MPTHLVTHTDTDGLGCEVIVRSVRGAVEARRVEVHEVDEVVVALFAALGPAPAGAEVIVADHNLSAETAAQAGRFLEAGGSVRLFDHHRTTLHLAGLAWAVVDLGRSATRLCFDELGAGPRYREFAELVDDTDLGTWSDPRSSELATLSVSLRPEVFVARFLEDPSCASWRPEEAALIDWEDRRMAEYVAACEGAVRVYEAAGSRVGVLFAEEFKNAVARHLMEKAGLDAVAQVNARTGKVGLRGNRRIDLSQVAARLGGGGHAGAAALPLASLAAGADLESLRSEVAAAVLGAAPEGGR
ncbi:MAG: hypothetical protein ACREPI_09175 [Candidatus Dormibacterales bacterium]